MDTLTLVTTGWNLLLDVISASLILVIGWAIAGLASRTVRRVTARQPRLDRTLAEFAARGSRWLVLAITLVAVLGRFGVQTTSIVAVLGAAGLTIGLALQGTLSNVASGALLLTLRPFSLGDAVEIGATKGTVEEMGLFTTRIRAWDGVMVHIPNNAVWGPHIRNMSQASDGRIDVEVGVGSGGDVAEATRIVLGLLDAEPRILDEPAPEVTVVSLGANAVKLRLRAWTAPADLPGTTSDLQAAVQHALDEAGMGIASS